MKREHRCDRCGTLAHIETGAINRARRLGRGLYCGRECSGLARRTDTRTGEQKRADKAAYDQAYRERNPRTADQRRAYHLATYDQAKAAEYRKSRMHLHVQYCRQPEYRAWKSGYDRVRRARMMFGPFADAALLLGDLEGEIASRASRYEIYSANGTLNKALQRRRAYVGSIVGGQPQERTLGDASGGQERQHAGGPRRRDCGTGAGNPAHGQDAAAGLPAGEAQRTDRDHRLRGEGVTSRAAPARVAPLSQPDAFGAGVRSTGESA